MWLRAARLSETNVAFAGQWAGQLKPLSPVRASEAGQLKPLSPLLAWTEPRLKPLSPLRVRNGCLWCVLWLQWCHRFQRLLFRGEQW